MRGAISKVHGEVPKRGWREFYCQHNYKSRILLDSLFVQH
jgi:hypothetical protein